jgi:hypothetical protein
MALALYQLRMTKQRDGLEMAWSEENKAQE